MAGLIRGFTGYVAPNLEKSATRFMANSFMQGFSAASDAHTAKGTGEDLMKCFTGKMSPDQFSANAKSTLLSMAVSGTVGRFIGPNMGTMVGLANDARGMMTSKE